MNKRLIIYALLGTILFLYELHLQNYFLAISALAGTVLILLGSLRNNSLHKSSIKLLKGAYEEAERELKKVNSEGLSPKKSAIYYFNYAFIYFNKKDYKAAEKAFEKALSLPLVTENDQAIAHLQLAVIYLQQRRLQKVKDSLTSVEKLNYKANLIVQIKRIKQQLNSIIKKTKDK